VILPGRCGTCASFPGDNRRCPNDTARRGAVYANDYGDKDEYARTVCANYVSKEESG